MAHSSQSYGSIDQRDLPDVGFSPTELYSLSENITTNIYTINASYRTLDRAYKNIGFMMDYQGLRNKVHITQISTNQVVTQTSKDITRLTVLMKHGNKQQKLQIEKLTSDFKDALQKYSDMQRLIADKMKSNILVTSCAEPQKNENDKQILIQIKEDDEKRRDLRALEFDHGMILEQEERIKQIEGDILDVNQIMKELGAVIYQQADSINSIESNIENVYGQVTIGNQELQKASNYQSKFRRKMCFLVLIAVIFTSILITVTVGSKS